MSDEATEVLAVTQEDRDAVQAFHRAMLDDLMADIKSKKPSTLGDDKGDAGHLVQAFARHRLAATADRDAVEERMGEAMFHLSDRLQAIGALDSDNVHAAYERVVAAWSALSTPAGEDRP